jgi:hypothetical protein
MVRRALGQTKEISVLYEVEVIEQVAQHVLYFVEADSPEEAEEKALAGDTVKEQTINEMIEVSHRELFSIAVEADDENG